VVQASMFSLAGALVSGLVLPPQFVALNSTQGATMLHAPNTLRASYDASAIHMVSQIDQASCGRASASVVLNALVPQAAPVAPEYTPYPYWTQSNFVGKAGSRTELQQCVATNCTAPCSLDQAVGALNCVPGITATGLHANEIVGEVAALEDIIRTVVGTPGSMIVANFKGEEAMANLSHGGHFSPIVAIDEHSMVLVLDVSRYKYPPWWVPIRLLWSGVNTISSDGTPRGVYVARSGAKASHSSSA